MVKHTREKAQARFFRKNPSLGCLYEEMNARDKDMVLVFLKSILGDDKLHVGSMALLSTKRVYSFVNDSNKLFVTGAGRYVPKNVSGFTGAHVLTRLRLGWLRTISRKNRRLRSKRYNYDTLRSTRAEEASRGEATSKRRSTKGAERRSLQSGRSLD